MTAYLLTLLRPHGPGPLLQLAEAVVPGDTPALAAEGLAAALNLGLSPEGTLVLHLEPGAKVRPGDLIFDGWRTWQVVPLGERCAHEGLLLHLA